jgi:hypothetical protein
VALSPANATLSSRCALSTAEKQHTPPSRRRPPESAAAVPCSKKAKEV